MNLKWKFFRELIIDVNDAVIDIIHLASKSFSFSFEIVIFFYSLSCVELFSNVIMSIYVIMSINEHETAP